MTVKDSFETFPLLKVRVLIKGNAKHLLTQTKKWLVVARNAAI